MDRVPMRAKTFQWSRTPNPLPLAGDTERHAMHDRAVSKANELYNGGSVDWNGIEAATGRMMNAETREELNAAYQAYIGLVPQ